MRESRVAQVLAAGAQSKRVAKLLLKTVAKLEGGEMASETLRGLLRSCWNIELGPFSYGVMTDPDQFDRETVIGRYVSIGPNVRRFGAAHPMDRVSMHPLFYRSEYGLASEDDDVQRFGCTIGDDAWIGANSVILPGCARIGRGAVVGAASVVTHDVGEFEIVAGSPARLIGMRFDKETRGLLSLENPWSLPPNDLYRYIQEHSGLATLRSA